MCRSCFLSRSALLRGRVNGGSFLKAVRNPFWLCLQCDGLEAPVKACPDGIGMLDGVYEPRGELG